MPSLEDIYNDYHSLGFEAIAVNRGESMSTVRNYARQYSYLFLLDADLSTWSLYSQTGTIPLNYVIDNDPNMTVVFWMENFSEPIIRFYIELCLEGIQEDPTSEIGNPKFELAQNYPNPFTSTTTIPFSLPPRHGDSGTGRQGDVSTCEGINLSVYDLSGRLVRILVDEPSDHPTIEPSNQVVWDGTDDAGRRAAPGVYFYRLTAGDYSDCRKLTVFR